MSIFQTIFQTETRPEYLLTLNNDENGEFKRDSKGLETCYNTIVSVIV